MTKATNLLAYYNMVPNIVWSVLNLTPISVYCFNFLSLTLLYIFLGVSLVPIFLRNSWIDKLRLSKSVKVYKNLGVHIINKVSQNGVIINRLVKRKFPEYIAVSKDRSSILRLIKQTYVFEKFHLVLFVFFMLVTAHALVKGSYYWALVVGIANVAYNIYPNLLQQYMRLKLSRQSKQ